MGSRTASTVPAVMPPCIVRYSPSAGSGGQSVSVWREEASNGSVYKRNYRRK